MTNIPRSSLRSTQVPWGIVEIWIKEGKESGQGARLVEVALQGLSASDPMPLRTAVAQLVEAAQAKDLAARLPASRASEFQERADSAIEKILDDFCGTPWPWPGPPTPIFRLAAELSAEAYGFEAGALRDSLLGIAEKALERGGALEG